MRKTLVMVLVLGLVAGSLLSPAAAGKRKKKKKTKPPVVVELVATDMNLYLHRNSCGEPTDVTSLSTTDDEDGGDDCGAAESGLPTEVFEQTGQDPPPAPTGDDVSPDRTLYAAADGIPFVLDATKEIRGSIALSSFCCGAAGISAGQAKMHALVSGMVDGADKVIGEATVEYLVTPDKGSYIVEFSITPDTALDKATFTTLDLTITNRGVSYLNAFYSYDEPSSLITVGTWK